MERKTKRIETKSFDVTVELEEFKDMEWPNLSVYAFNKSGRLLAKAPLKQDVKTPTLGKATLKVGEVGLDLVVEVGPNVEDANLLKKYKPAVARLPEKERALKYELARPFWMCWIKVPYHVTGNVKKTGGDPICVGEVDVYDVDIKYCLPWIPDIIIEKIRDGIIDIIVNPPPSPPFNEFEKPLVWWDWEDDDYCGTVPKPPFPPKRVDINKKLDSLPPEWGFAKWRLESLSTVRERINNKLKEVSFTEQTALLNTEVVEGVNLSQILYSNTNQFRSLIIEKFVVFRYFLCWWPWIYWLWWPYCGYSLEKLGTAQLNPDGSFSLTVPISICRNDTPDLWFVVRQKIDGVERVIYARHPVPCNTYWNHPSGKPVNLLVNDPLAVACQQPSSASGDNLVVPMGIYEDEWYQVDQAHIKAPCVPSTPLPYACGLYNSTDPYGTRLDIRMQFNGDLLHSISPSNGATYYRWSYRKHGSEDWVHIKTPITHRYLKKVGGEYFIDSEPLGPVNLSTTTEKDLFNIPDPNKAWLANRNDLAYAIWHTATWNGEKYLPQISDGKYDLLLEIFDKNGNKLNPTTAGFKFALPTGYTGPLDKTLYVQNDGLILHVHVDNNDTIAEIMSVAINGSKAAECQFLEYDLTTELRMKKDDVGIEYVAYHPTPAYNFLDKYELKVRRGISGTVVKSKTSTVPEVTPKTEKYKVVDLLGTYDRCSFAVWLHTFSRTRDGHGRIRAYESSDSSAFALIEKTTT
jgi:hypothetical protein